MIRPLTALLLCSTTFIAAEDWIAPTDAAAVKNPTATSAESISAGKAIYERNCLVCHGATGLGDGAGATYLTPKPAKLSDTKIQQQSDGAMFWKISTGRGLMTGWSAMLKDKERWDLVNYLRTFAAK